MSPKEAVTDIFMTAFRALSSAEQDAILAKMVQDRELREDLIDLAIAEARSHERSRSFQTFLAQIKKELKGR